jgi:hypothetical protein
MNTIRRWAWIIIFILLWGACMVGASKIGDLRAAGY